MPSEPPAALDAGPGDAVLDVADEQGLPASAMVVCLVGVELGRALARWSSPLAYGAHGIDHLPDHAIALDVVARRFGREREACASVRMRRSVSAASLRSIGFALIAVPRCGSSRGSVQRGAAEADGVAAPMTVAGSCQQGGPAFNCMRLVSRCLVRHMPVVAKASMCFRI